MTDESETPDAMTVSAEEPPFGEEFPPGAEGSAGRNRVSGDAPAHAEHDVSDDRPGDDVGRVIAFPPRPGTGATTRSSDRAQRETAEGAASSGDAFPRYGHDLANDPGFGGAVLTTDVIIDDPLPVDAADDGQPVDWAWVEEWRAGQEPVPWASGLGLAGFSALVVGVAVWVLSAGLAGSPVLAIGVNLLVAGGLAPAMWLSRGLPVLRWVALGSAVGVIAGWVCALAMLPLPTP